MRIACIASLALLGCSGTTRDPIDSGHDTAHDAASSDAVAQDAPVETDSGVDAAVIDPCGGAPFCELFDGYDDVSAITDGQRFGPWRASLRSPGATAELDDAHVVSGDRALHVRLEEGTTSGLKLFASGDVPLVRDHPTHVYGRFMMYVDPNGTSTHWTVFGVSGDTDPASPVPDRNASYVISSLPRAGVNTYSVVDGLEMTADDPFHDCWFQSTEPMPTARWSCVSFEMDSDARRIRVSIDEADAIIALDDHGQGCVGDVVPDDEPWYGPVIEQLFIGTWSYHEMNAPLEVWIDDLAVSTTPVACPEL